MAQEIKSEEIVLNENEIVCLLTNKIVKVSEKETNLQYMIQRMFEYRLPNGGGFIGAFCGKLSVNSCGV